MATFSVGQYSIEVRNHTRTITNGRVTEQFTVAASFQGQPLNWNNGPNVETFRFVGKESQDVYNTSGVKVGTKMGADFRSTFWPTVIRRAVATRQGVRMGQATNLPNAPVNLRTLSRDAAVTRLVG